MYLLVKEPSDDDFQRTGALLYAKVKSLITLLETAGRYSLRVLQSRLLVTLFELGHDINHSAYVSIGTCASSGVALGIDELPLGRWPPDINDWIKQEEERRAWWAIVLLDRYANLRRGSHAFVSRDPRPESLLPVDDDAWDQGVLPPGPPMPMSTPSSTRVGPFARQVQVAHLLGRVLRHINDATQDKLFQRQEAEQLDRTLAALALLLTFQAHEKYGSYCGAMGMVNSALMLLREAPSWNHNHDMIDNGHLQRTNTTAADVADDIIQKYNESDPKTTDYTRIPPFVIYSIYQAGLVTISQSPTTHDARCSSALASLKTILDQFSRRWNVASKIFLSSSSRDLTGYPR
ncbi:hypothetical protein AYO20_09433 [Fonsecaea nubica]|uniref:Xylanolytic transcriptional activator regulatory domain-containing protein n=1 Tax=Fonsecaea nubica TaxID=856822 RepID=A0A178CHD6_9EURO|nr:hypothetical protein AYO20_09433 [Fonsecaea nubica]OAL28485.1 hypothetical protein AYO20_09433 [Fonsecaea nubica]